MLASGEKTSRGINTGGGCSSVGLRFLPPSEPPGSRPWGRDPGGVPESEPAVLVISQSRGRDRYGWAAVSAAAAFSNPFADSNVGLGLTESRETLAVLVLIDLAPCVSFTQDLGPRILAASQPVPERPCAQHPPEQHEQPHEQQEAKQEE